MASSGGVFSQTLQEITTTKLQELAKKRASFEQLKSAAIADADRKQSQVDMLIALADGVKACFGIRVTPTSQVIVSDTNYRLGTDLQNLSRFIDQARFDPSVSTKIVQKWRRSLLAHLDVQSLKYQYADLYGQLTVEWLTSTKPASAERKLSASDSIDSVGIDDFEKVSVKAKLAARESWERDVFDEAKVDNKAIQEFLDQLFTGPDAQKALKRIRDDVLAIENGLLAPRLFNKTTLTWAINGLLDSDLMTNEKRGVLRDFLSNDTILTELADVLNMRMGALDSWSWGTKVEVEARRELNGRYKMYMHEDLLQAIFLQYIGISWSVGIKSALMTFVWNTDVWKNGTKAHTPLDSQRRHWYLGPSSSSISNVQKERGLYYRAGYYVSQLLNNPDQNVAVEDGAVEADFSLHMAPAAAAAAPPPKKKMMMMRGRDREDHARIAADDSDEDMGFGLFDDGPSGQPDLEPYRPKNSMDAKQQLLHLLSTEVLVRSRVHGDITSFRSQFASWYPSLPHSTIITVLAYLGVSQKWLDFFKTFLEAPLKFIDEDTQPRPRKRGTPDAHILSDVFGESVLFCLDFAIHRKTEGEYLWRMGDDFWFWSSSYDSCASAWTMIGDFSKVMGINLDDKKSAAVRFRRKDGKLVPARLGKPLPEGHIRWGMLYLNPKTGTFTIDEDLVDKHIEELRRQLKDKEKSIFAWVQAYSTYASVFFTTNFGKSANCFGRDHVDMILGMHERIQKTLFSATAEGDQTSVVDWLKNQIEQRFGVKDLPDGYLFFPTELGGLDVKSPFIGPLLLRESVTKDPEVLLDQFEEAEREKYEQLKKRYLAKKAWEYPAKHNEYRPDDPEEFMPFEEYIKFREELTYEFPHELLTTYKTLLQQPEQRPLEIRNNADIETALENVGSTRSTGKGITYWHAMDPYWKWVTMLYGPEMLQKFGGFEIVDSGLLPMGMVSMFRSGRVSWQE